jgi:hypothetical protein
MDRLRSIADRKTKRIYLQRTPRRWRLNEDGITTIIKTSEMSGIDCWKIFCQQISQISELESVSVDGRIRKQRQ